MEGNSDQSKKKDQNIDFVLLIEENNVVLEKSQLPSMRKKKEEAIAIIIEKWTTISGITLTHESFLKKLNNVKGRARSALNKGNQLSLWQSKILALTADELTKPGAIQLNSNEDLSNENGEKAIVIEVLGTGPSMGGDGDGTLEAEKIKAKVEGFINKFENDDTKYLTTEQLQRVAVLQKIKIQALQQKKLEMQINNANFSFDFSALNPLNVSTADLN